MMRFCDPDPWSAPWGCPRCEAEEPKSLDLLGNTTGLIIMMDGTRFPRLSLSATLTTTRVSNPPPHESGWVTYLRTVCLDPFVVFVVCIITCITRNNPRP
jgi:hypothetical protein